MSTTLPAPEAGEARGLRKEIAKVIFYIVNAFVRPAGDMFELTGKLTFRPQPREVVWGAGDLTVSVVRNAQAALNADTVCMEIIVPGPSRGSSALIEDISVPDRDVYALVCGCTRVRIIPNQDYAGVELGTALLTHLDPRIDSIVLPTGVWSFPGIDGAEAGIPVRIAAPDFRAMDRPITGVIGWDRSAVYRWEAGIAFPPTIDASDKITAPPAVSTPDSAPAGAPGAKAKAPRHQGRRPSANGTKRM